MKEFKYVITDAEGIHARPATMLGIFSFSKENIPLTPPRERTRGVPSTPNIGSLQLE